MTNSYTYTNTKTHTITQARYIASKVIADLKRIQHLCGVGEPSDQEIEDYKEEMVTFLSKGYLEKVKYGFQRNDQWIEPTVEYTAQELLEDGADDRPGGIRPSNVQGAHFTSYLWYSQAWYNLTEQEKASIKNDIPVKRTTREDASSNGVMVNDRSYSSGHLGLNRSMLRRL